MLFDSHTLHDGISFAEKLWSHVRTMPPDDALEVLLGCFSGASIKDKAKCQAVLKRVSIPECETKEKHVLMTIVAMSELDRLCGWRRLLPVELADLISHMLPTDEKVPVVCHGERMLQLALWFAAQSRRVFFTGKADLLPHISAISGGLVEPEEGKCVPVNAGHLAACDYEKHDLDIGSLLRQLETQNFLGAVILSSWSFLSSTTPNSLSLKQNMLRKGRLLSVVQLPKAVIPRVLPALLQIGKSDSSREVRLVDAKEWSVNSHQGPAISYLDPILAQAWGHPLKRLPKWTPKPPVQVISNEALLQSNCDLRLKHSALSSPDYIASREITLGACAALVRGQMLVKADKGEALNTFQEVTLSDIDGNGFITSASRLMDDAAPLPRSRRVARLRKGDVLIVCKGALQSLGKIGLVISCGDNWLPSQTYYLVRAEGIDPIWLFYFLRSEQAQTYLRSNISGTTIPQIRAADIAAVPIPLPDDEKLARMHEQHAQALKLKKRIDKLQEDLDSLFENCFELTRRN